MIKSLLKNRLLFELALKEGHSMRIKIRYKCGEFNWWCIKCTKRRNDKETRRLAKGATLMAPDLTRVNEIVLQAVTRAYHEVAECRDGEMEAEVETSQRWETLWRQNWQELESNWVQEVRERYWRRPKILEFGRHHITHCLGSKKALRVRLVRSSVKEVKFKS